jgi:lysine 2,3-aminomutase
MSIAELYSPSVKGQTLLESLASEKYDRQIIAGVQKFADKNAPEELKAFYSADQLAEILRLKGTERDIEERMPVKVTRHYFNQAMRSRPMQQLVKADPAETIDLDGAPDPGKQMDYSPIEGMIHKYELALLYVAATCSAHCRFCYREELIARKEVVRPNGEVGPKGLAQIEEVVDYIKQHNLQVAGNGGLHPKTGRERLREVLMSGGDPMVLSNRKIASWWVALSEAGIESIRLGTKELAFFPDRFDSSFFDMLDKFHAAYPETKLRFVVHFNHPDEFLQKDDHGNYIEQPGGGLKWLESTKKSVTGLAQREWVSLDNQSPIIKGINDDPDALRIMQRELKRNRIENHYFFCGRDIIGHKAFNVPIETAWRVLTESQKGLSGIEAHARLSITHYRGKTEVVAVTNDPIPGLRGAENGVVILKLHRGVAAATDKGKITILGRNPDAIWFDGYNDRVLFDEAKLYSNCPIVSQDR